MLSYVQFGWLIDDLWEVGMIRTRADRRREGLAKALLSQSSEELLERGIVPAYSVRATSVASLRTARAVGYREAFRVLGCSARVH